MANGTSSYKLGEHSQAIADIQMRVKSIEAKVDELNVWKWKLVGVVTGLAMGGNMVAEIIIKYLKV